MCVRVGASEIVEFEQPGKVVVREGGGLENADAKARLAQYKRKGTG